MFGFGLIVDNLLRAFGIGISGWFDSLWDSILASFCGFIVAPIFWRIGLVTLPQYLLGAFALVVPITLVSILILSQFHNVGIEMPGINHQSHPNQYVALTAYIRLFRSMIFTPVYLACFYWMFHVALGMKTKYNAGK